ncbi:YhbY family RNA-binding protein [Traorella massiliensis]|uniref:YhbY family RNA-binding protein n=1 Tax=Traorella massiliensis TaxID=1903263 RepID=UPI0008F96CF1|nr:YhbY family RNA-binding protein [Traorella massiliensis]
MLDGKAKSKLRGMAQTRKAIVMIGKEGVSDTLCATLSDSLKAHELVKISCLKTSPISVREAAIQCASATHSEIVQIIGHTFVLYRKSEKNLCQL